MEHLTNELEKLRLAQDCSHIDEIIQKLEASSYVSGSTRARVVDLLRRVPGPDSEASALVNVFLQPSSKYIPRDSIRKTIKILRSIHYESPSWNASWTTEHWFSLLVDGNEVVLPLREILNELDVCRFYASPSLTKIVVYGAREQGAFYDELVDKCQAQESILQHITGEIAKSIVKYYGGVSMVGSSDCLR
jgi:hypothetical protein